MTRLSSTSFSLFLISLCFITVLASSKLNNLRFLSNTHSSHDGGHVDADDHAHSVELHACTGASLELTGDATLQVTNVDNAKHYLVTNVELETCDEIEKLTCRPGSSFCKAWAANSNQNIDLPLFPFHGGHAHLYVQAINKNRPVSVNIALHPKGHQNANVNSNHHDSHGVDESHVDDDNKYHALEIKACSGTALDLPTDGDHIFDVSNVDNAHRYMITDIQLESCEEIKALSCRPGAGFCHIWNAKDDEAVLLNRTSFPHKEAYFYVEPVNERNDVSVNVKVSAYTTDGSGMHVVGDDHRETNTAHTNGGHTEEHVDADGHTHALQIHACSGSTLELTGDSVAEVKGVFNAKRYMISNVEMQTCEAIEAFKCDAHASFCHIWNAGSDEKVILKYGMFTKGEAFFYAEPLDSKQEVSVNLKLVPQGAQVKAAHESNHEEEHVIVDSHTHALEIKACSGATLGMSGDTVLEAHNADNAKAFLVTNLELETCEDIGALKCHDDASVCHVWTPDQNEDVLLELTDFPNAEAHFYAQPVDPKHQVAVNIKLSTLGLYNSTGEKAEHGQLVSAHVSRIPSHIKDLILEAAAVLLFVVLTMSYCYRRYLSKYRRVPCNTPFWCPNFLFPAPETEGIEAFIASEDRKAESQELKGGIIRQVEV